MAREYQSTRDRNILNSWDKGGKFEGKQVTDQVLLKHLADRRNGLAKDDPLYDEMDQRLTEYTFAVDNSKMELKYAEGKVSDGGMAAFYARAATKLPQNSEAWRKMKTLAAQYKDRAHSGGGGGGGGGRKSTYNSEANKIPLKKEVAYDAMMETLTGVALREGILQTTTEDLGDLRAFEGDATRLQQLMEVFNSDPKYAPERDRLKAHVKKWGNPNFSGVLTWDTLHAEKTNKDAGLEARIRKAQKAGNKGDAKTLLAQYEKGNTAFNTATAAGPLADYENAHKEYEIDTGGEDVTPLDTWMAAQKYAAKLTGIHDQVREAAINSQDPRLSDMTGRLNNELVSLSGQGDINAPTLWESSRGVVAGSLGGENKGDTAKNVEAYAGLREQVGLLLSGDGVIMRVDNNGQQTDDPKAGYGVVPRKDVEAGAAWVPTGGHMDASVRFEGKDYPTSQVMTAVIPTRVFATASGELDYTGRPTRSSATPKSNENIANFFEMPDGTRLAQYWDSDGKKRWTNDPDGMFTGGAKPELTREGYVITVENPNKSSKTYDPTLAIDDDFRISSQADKLVNKVGLTSFATWLNSNRTNKSDPGVAYAMDPNVVRAAITAEVGTAKPLELAAALHEAEGARTDYLRKTTDVDRRIREIAKAGDPQTIADKLTKQGYGDAAGLARDVRDFYGRLEARKKGEMLEDPRGAEAAFTRDQTTERDKIIHDALDADPATRNRLLAIENPDALLPSHIKDLMHQQQVKDLGPGFVTMDQWNRENQMIRNFKDLQQGVMGGWAKALSQGTIPATFPTGPQAGPNASGKPTTSPPPPKAPPPLAPVKSAKADGGKDDLIVAPPTLYAPPRREKKATGIREF